MTRRAFLQKKLNGQLALMFGLIITGMVTIIWIQSVPVAVGVVIAFVVVSRTGYRRFKCPCCRQSVYNAIVKETNLFLSQVPSHCPRCGCNYDEPV
ncbi:hypothetical protein ACXWTF_02945 [Thiomicrolovo sp. ZZH C-3]